MRISLRLRKRFTLMLAAMLLLQAAPVFTRAQSPGRREKLVDRQEIVDRQELSERREDPQTSATGWRPKMARDLNDAVESAKGRPDRMRRVIIQLTEKKPGAGSNQIKGIMLTDAAARNQCQLFLQLIEIGRAHV